MQKVWIRVALAALAGVGSLAVCCVAFLAIVALILSGGNLFGIPLYLRPEVYWIGLVTAVPFAVAGFSLPALALGARWQDALKAAVLSSPVFLLCTLWPLFPGPCCLPLWRCYVPVLQLSSRIGRNGAALLENERKQRGR